MLVKGVDFAYISITFTPNVVLTVTPRNYLSRANAGKVAPAGLLCVGRNCLFTVLQGWKNMFLVVNVELCIVYNASNSAVYQDTLFCYLLFLLNESNHSTKILN